MTRHGFASDRMKRIDDLIDDLLFMAGWGAIVGIGMVVAFVVAVRVFGGAS